MPTLHRRHVYLPLPPPAVTAPPARGPREWQFEAIRGTRSRFEGHYSATRAHLLVGECAHPSINLCLYQPKPAADSDLIQGGSAQGHRRLACAFGRHVVHLHAVRPRCAGRVVRLHAVRPRCAGRVVRLHVLRRLERVRIALILPSVGEAARVLPAVGGTARVFAQPGPLRLWRALIDSDDL